MVFVLIFSPMKETLDRFFQIVTAQLKLICEGRYEATDEVLKFSDTEQNDPNVSELAETVGLMSVKLEAREMALERTIEDLKQSLSDRRQFSMFFMLFIFFISVFTFISAYTNQSGLTQQEVDIISPLVCLGFLLLLIVLSVIYIRFSPFSLKDFGLTFRGSRRAIVESMLASLPIIAIITLARFWCGSHLETFQGKPFFDTTYLGYAFWIYLFVAPGQEFVARGVTQSLIFRMIGGKHSMFWSILLASLIFAVTHTYFSFWISVLSIFGGFFWGWLYSRHGTIVGVSISHFILGNYLGITGFWTFLQ